MKNLFLLLLALPLVLVGQESDWFPIPSDQVSYFSKNNGLYSMRIDSIKESGNIKIYYNVRNPEYVFSSGIGHYNPLGSWLGTTASFQDGTVIFENKDGEEIFFDFTADSYEEQRMYNYANGSYINIFQISKDYGQIVDDLYDSVRIYSIVAYNADGSINEGFGSGSRIILSKQYGFVKAFNFSQFPYHVHEMRLIGIEQRDQVFGFSWDYDEMITGYEVGDVIQLKKVQKFAGSKTEEYIAKRLTDRYVEYDLKVVEEGFGSMRTETRRFYLGLLPGQTLLTEQGYGQPGYVFYYLNGVWNGGQSFNVRKRQNVQVFDVDGKEYWGVYLSQEVQHEMNNSHWYMTYQGAGPFSYEIGYVKTSDYSWGEYGAYSVSDYQAVRPDMEIYYSNSRAVRIDSIADMEDAGTYYYTYNTLEFITTDDDYYYYDPFSSWIGNPIKIMSDGMNIFNQKDGREISINTRAGINEEWDLYHLEDGGVIRSKVIDIEYRQIIDDVYDSVKIIANQAYNESGETVSHQLNSVKFWLSKHYGLVNMPYFYNFYGGHSIIVGIKAPDFEVGAVNYLPNQIFNSLSIGDEFHYYWLSEDYRYYIKRTITGKQIEGQKLQYFYKICKNTRGLGFDSTNIVEELNESIVFPINFMPQEVIWDTTILGVPFYFNLEKGGTDFCGNRTHYRYGYIEGYSNTIYQGRPVWRVHLDLGGHYNRVPRWTENLGWYYSDRGEYSSPDNPVYMRNEIEECGTPFDFSCETGLEEVDNSALTILPNPSKGLVYIYSLEKIEEVLVHNLNGQLVWRVDELIEGSIDLSHLENGIYLLNIKTQNQNIIHRKVIINR